VLLYEFKLVLEICLDLKLRTPAFNKKTSRQEHVYTYTSYAIALIALRKKRKRGRRARNDIIAATTFSIVSFRTFLTDQSSSAELSSSSFSL
jgi:VanZ family protein